MHRARESALDNAAHKKPRLQCATLSGPESAQKTKKTKVKTKTRAKSPRRAAPASRKKIKAKSSPDPASAFAYSAMATAMAKADALKKREIAIHVIEVKPRRFSLNDAQDRKLGLAHLDLEGYVVWKDAAGDQKEIDAHVSRFWDYVERACAGVLRCNPETWTNARWPAVLSMFIFRYHGIGQSEFMWKIRTLPAFRTFFQSYYAHHRRHLVHPTPTPAPAHCFARPGERTAEIKETKVRNPLREFPLRETASDIDSGEGDDGGGFRERNQGFVGARGDGGNGFSEGKQEDGAADVSPIEFATSFDGCSALRGAEHAQKFSDSWLHTDRNLRVTPDPLGSIQCALNLISGVPSTSGGFLCVPRSHTHYAHLVASGDAEALAWMGKTRSHYLPIPARHPMTRPFEDEQGRVRCVALCVESGDMVAWSSSLIHANTPPTDKTVRGQLRRLAPFVSYFPKSEIQAHVRDPEAWLAARKAACAQGFTAGHDPVSPSENNRSPYPRHKTFQAVETPPACKKTLFRVDELALL